MTTVKLILICKASECVIGFHRHELVKKNKKNIIKFLGGIRNGKRN